MSNTYGERRGKLTVTIQDPDPGYAQADADLAALGVETTSQVLRTGASEAYLQQLRLRVAEDPSLLSHIEVFWTDANGVQHRIGLTQEDSRQWPDRFCMTALDVERRILDLRFAAATPERDAREPR